MVQLQGSLGTPVNSSSSSGLSDPSGSFLLSEESDSGADRAYYATGEPHAGDFELSFFTNSIMLHFLDGVIGWACFILTAISQ